MEFCLFSSFDKLIIFFCTVHAAVIAINDAIDHQDAGNTLEALRNPNAHLRDVNAENSEPYQSALYQAKSTKAAQAIAKVGKDLLDLKRKLEKTPG